MDARLERLVRERAGACCEYCRFPEEFSALPFQMDHIVARQHRGITDPSNLALACCYCNRYKGPNLTGIDPSSGATVPLFNPRTERWSEHFRWNGPILEGLTPVGRTTVVTLSINRPDALAVRELLIEDGVKFRVNE